MQSPEDKGAMLAAYLDNELDESERAAIERRIKTGDTRLIGQLDELAAARAESKIWCSEMSSHISEADLWPGIEAQLRKELSSRDPELGRNAESTPSASSRRRLGPSSRPEFSRGFSWGFMGGLAAACASFAAVLLVDRQGELANFIGEREMVPLTSVAHSNIQNHNGSIASSVSSTSSSAQPASEASLSGTQLAKEDSAPSNAAGQERALALVSAGKDVGSAEELALNGPIFVLPADLFADARAIERNRRPLNEELAVQLLSPNNAVPSGREDAEMMARLNAELYHASRQASSFQGQAFGPTLQGGPSLQGPSYASAAPAGIPTGFPGGAFSGSGLSSGSAQASVSQNPGPEVTRVSNSGKAASSDVH